MPDDKKFEQFGPTIKFGTIGPKESKEVLLHVPDDKPFDIELTGDCQCGGKLVRVGKTLKWRCNRRWRIWRKHAKLELTLTKE